MTLQAGASLAHYTILGPLGAGAMGEVYRAKDGRLGREVAIKVLPEHFAADADRLKRFEREAQTLASLNHPNVAQIFGVDQVGDTCFLVLELVEGESLEERLKRGPLPLEEALDVCRQIAEGLEAAHEAGVIHRDLKPANVRLAPDGKVKVLDFGLAKPMRVEPASGARPGASPGAQPIGSPGAQPVASPGAGRGARPGSSLDSVLSTEQGRLLGTPTYMAPEQARGKSIDKRVDIWAFGCVLYEGLTAKRAFAGETLTDVLATVLEREPDWTALPPETSPRIRELLGNCLAKDRRNRLHDIGDARLQIERALAGREWIPAAAAAESARRGARRPSAVMLLLAAAAFVALGAGLWSVLGPRTRGEAEPTCVSVAMPPEIAVTGLMPTTDGRTLVALGRPRESSGSGAAQQRFYVRRLDGYEFKPLAGTEGAQLGFPTRDSRGLHFVAPVSPGAAQKQLAFVPLDGSAPPTSLAEWKDTWGTWVELPGGDILIHDGSTSFLRLPKAGGPPSSPVPMDAGRPGVVRFEFHMQALPGDHGVLVNVVAYGTRGFQYSVGVLDPASGHVKVIVEDGGSAAWSPTGHLVFARGDVILAAPFDLERAEVLGAPVAVWSGLEAAARAFPGFFRLTDAGALCYLPGQGYLGRALAILGEGGTLEPWSSERMFLSAPPMVSPDGRRALCQIINARGIDELWTTPVEHADFVKLSSETNADCFSGVWSPDSRQVAYLRVAKDDKDGVYIQDIDGGKPRRVLGCATDEFMFPTAWFPDGTALLLHDIFNAQGSSIRLLPLGDTEADTGRLLPFLPSDSRRGNARLSSDGRLLAFSSNEAGMDQTWVTEMRPGGESGRPVRVRTAEGRWHAWAADGRTLFVQDERDRLMKVAVSVEPQLSVSEPVVVADLERLGIQQWGVLPDDRFLVSLKSDGEGEVRRIDMVLNWTGILDRLVPLTK